MAWQDEFFFFGERGIVGFEVPGVLVGDEIAFGRAVGGVGDGVGLEPARNELLGKEIRDFSIAGFGVVVYAETAGETETGMFIEVDVSLHAEESDAELAGFV